MIRWLIPIIGLLAISVLIWFGGPMVAFNGNVPFASVLNRILLILIIIILWALIHLWKLLKEKKNNEKMMEGLSEDEKKPAPSKTDSHVSAKENEDAPIIQKNFQEALGVLKKTKLKGTNGEQHLYALPWYIIIGPPGAGKTTALANSGLRFPLGDRFGQLALRGIGGTRDCDWWFTDEAVLIDTAGRYTTQDSDASLDSGGWNSFLGQLKKYRTRRPINGVFVAISLSELLQQSELERSRHANAIKHRIQELNEKLGINVPVYILFTKCDLVAGFMEFFDDLGREDRAQIWGVTLPLDDTSNPQGVVNQFAQEFDSLIQRLNARIMNRLQQERVPQRRSLIHAFPYQMAALKDVADKFLKEIFLPSRYENRFLLRGVYFTSGTQEGTPIDRMMGSLAATFGLDRQTAPSFSGQGRSYFLTHLFHDVIFKESNLVGTNRKFEMRRQWIQRSTFAGAIVLTAISILAWFTSYNGNGNYIQAANVKLAEFDKAHAKITRYSDVPDAIPALTALRQAAFIYDDEKVSGFTGLGLSQKSNINEAGVKAYKAALLNIFVPLIRNHLEKQLSSGNSNPDFILNALKAYLLLGDPAHREKDPEFIKKWIEQDYQNAFAGDPEGAKQLHEHLDYLTNPDHPFPAVPLNDNVVTLARDTLNRFPEDELVYSRLKQEARESQIPDFVLSKILDNSNPVFASQQGIATIGHIPSLYTYNGFHDFYLKKGLNMAKESTAENWVMGDKAKQTSDPKALDLKVRKRYLKDYTRYWRNLLNGLNIVKFTSLNQGVSVLDSLSGANSPLRALLVAVNQNTNLDQSSGGSSSLLKAASSKSQKADMASKAGSKFSSLMGHSEGPGAEVTHDFADINKLVQSNKGVPPEVDGIIKTLSDVHAYLVGIAATTDGSTAFQAAAKKMSGQPDILSRLKLQSYNQKSPIKEWLENIANQSWSSVLANSRMYINNAWQAEVLDNYRRGLDGRYPLFSNSSREVTLADFSRFFSANGTMNKFFNKYMKPFINTGRRRWRLRVVDNQTLGISARDVRLFQKANIIKETFFSQGGDKPVVQFSLRPIDLDAAVTKFTLDIDQQRVIYRHGPTRSERLQWPGPSGSTGTKITFETTSNTHFYRKFEGDWGWFRALDYFHVRPTRQGDRLRVTFTLSNLKAQYELQASSVNNPFALGALINFRCPSRL